MKFTIRHVVYVIKQSVSPKMFTNERLFTIQAFTITRVHRSFKFFKSAEVVLATLTSSSNVDGALKNLPEAHLILL
jgi:hypothetical protein